MIALTCIAVLLLLVGELATAVHSALVSRRVARIEKARADAKEACEMLFAESRRAEAEIMRTLGELGRASKARMQ